MAFDAGGGNSWTGGRLDSPNDAEHGRDMENGTILVHEHPALVGARVPPAKGDLGNASAGRVSSSGIGAPGPGARHQAAVVVLSGRRASVGAGAGTAVHGYGCGGSD